MEEVGQYFDHVVYRFYVHRKTPVDVTLLEKSFDRTDSSVVAHVSYTQTISKDYARIDIGVVAKDGLIPNLFFIETQLVACLFAAGYEIDGMPGKDRIK